jgi:hypothetical protein
MTGRGQERVQENDPMTMKPFAAAAATAILLVTTAASAHHAFTAEFDGNQPVTLKGTISKVEWINPHSWVYVDIKEASGATTTWKIECGAPNQLMRRGWNKNSIPVGSQVTVEGYRAKNGSTTANAKDIIAADGKRFFVGSSGTGAPFDNDKK